MSENNQKRKKKQGQNRSPAVTLLGGPVSWGYLNHQLPFKTSHIHLRTDLSPVYVNMIFCTIKPAECTCSKQEQSASGHREERERRGEPSPAAQGRAERTQRRGLMLALQVITAIRTKPAKLLVIPFLFVLKVLFQALSVPPPSGAFPV